MVLEGSCNLLQPIMLFNSWIGLFHWQDESWLAEGLIKIFLVQITLALYLHFPNYVITIWPEWLSYSTDNICSTIDLILKCKASLSFKLYFIWNSFGWCIMIGTCERSRFSKQTLRIILFILKIFFESEAILALPLGILLLF